MTVKEIIKKYLEDNGFDGLCTDDCGCGIDDLFPCCEDMCADCVPAYKCKCDHNCGEYHSCWTSSKMNGCWREQ